MPVIAVARVDEILERLGVVKMYVSSRIDRNAGVFVIFPENVEVAVLRRNALKLFVRILVADVVQLNK